MIRGNLGRGALALLIGLSWLAVGTADATETLPPWCLTDGPIDSELVPSYLPPVDSCDLTGRQVWKGDVYLTVPEPGMAVSYLEEGPEATELALVRYPDGALLVTGIEAVVDNVNETITDVLDPRPDPCAPAVASAYTLDGSKAYDSFRWWYNPAGEPESVAGTALGAIALGGTSLVNGHNDCGMTTMPAGASHDYLGSTSRPSGAAKTCAFDGVNVVGWLPLEGPLATACSAAYLDRTPRRLAEGDISFNVNFSWTTSPCLKLSTGITPATYDIQDVATHEFGHIFGFNHVPEGHPTGTQTMSSRSEGPCDTTQRTLGRGDLNGMISLYGGI